MASEPFNIKKVYANPEVIDICYFDGDIPPFDVQDYANDEEESFIKDLEKHIRGSFEYQEWVSYLREYMDMSKCSVFKNITNMETFAIKIHLHHSPITLMEICVTVLQKRKFYRESLLLEAVAKEVMYLHYLLVIGIIPLCETVHELVHNQYYFVPNTKVLGRYKDFEKMYGPWIPTQVLSKLDRIEEWSRCYNEQDNNNVVKKNLILLDLGDNGVGMNIPKMEQMEEITNQKMVDLRANGFQTGPIQLLVRNPF